MNAATSASVWKLLKTGWTSVWWDTLLIVATVQVRLCLSVPIWHCFSVTHSTIRVCADSRDDYDILQLFADIRSCSLCIPTDEKLQCFGEDFWYGSVMFYKKKTKYKSTGKSVGVRQSLSQLPKGGLVRRGSHICGGARRRRWCSGQCVEPVLQSTTGTIIVDSQQSQCPSPSPSPRMHAFFYALSAFFIYFCKNGVAYEH